METDNLILTVKIERPLPEKKRLINILQRLEKHYLSLPYVILHSLLDSIETVYSQDLAKYDKLVSLKQSLPSTELTAHTAYFPHFWTINNIKQPEQPSLYRGWTLSPNTQPTITIQVNGHEIIAYVLAEKTIGLCFAKKPNIPMGPIAYAHAIYACCVAYPESCITIVINPQYKHCKELCLYIQAFEKMATCIAGEPLQPEFSIRLKDENKMFIFSEQELSDAIQRITRNIPDFMELFNNLSKRNANIQNAFPSTMRLS